MTEVNNNQENVTQEQRKPRRPSRVAEPATETTAADNTKIEPTSEGERAPRRPARTTSDDASKASDAERSPRRSSSRAGSKKKKPNQMPYGFAIVLAIIVFGLYLNSRSSNVALHWILGIGFGFILQRSRFCFTASMRDPYMTGSTTVTRAVLIAFAFTSIAFTAIKYGFFRVGMPIPGMGYVVPISVATGVGAFLFGIGMVIAGGCASGTLMRVGEGFQMQILSLFFFVVGSLWGAHDFGFWKRNFMLAGKKVFLPDVFGWFGGLMVNLLIIIVLYIIAEKWENRKGAAGH
jgi:uncharacterized protein